ncbi:acc synthase [Fusarium albosuccineum]|uniref:Acc synthase n=1 Tax=Fusarium albosuccineum TaxID=1237068 RepID=A0A8H4P1Z7_9HYPO|nr:acc synthase [Fusarium albosuccineum]
MDLSLRGLDAAKPSDTSVRYEVLGDSWHEQKNPSGYVNLGVAENTLAHEVLAKHIHEHIVLGSEHFTYGTGATGSPQLKQAIARFLGKYLTPSQPLEKSHITVTNGCSAAIEHLSWALANPGEGFLLGQPFYGTFIPDLTLRTGAKVVPVPFGSIDPLNIDAVSQYVKALLAARSEGIKVVGLVLCNPHNPLRRCYPVEFLIDIMRLC